MTTNITARIDQRLSWHLYEFFAVVSQSALQDADNIICFKTL